MAGLGVIHLAGSRGWSGSSLKPSIATLVLAVALYVPCGLSITAGYHRLFAHRTYRPAHRCGGRCSSSAAATFQNSALSWSADHRAHHADTDGPGDPHAITAGAWFAHVGWLFRRRAASADAAA